MDEIAHLAIHESDDERLLAHLGAFREQIPLNMCLDTSLYQGDFPNTSGLPLCLFQTARLEMTNEMWSLAKAQHLVLPPWLSESAQPTVFAERLAQGDFAGAWLSLNSSGWTYGQAIEAMKQLALAARDPVFAYWTDLWGSLPHEPLCKY